ncbi:hypothetical protein SLE2022_340890 [Rubroshorea leprosula]
MLGFPDFPFSLCLLKPSAGVGLLPVCRSHSLNSPPLEFTRLASPADLKLEPFCTESKHLRHKEKTKIRKLLYSLHL